jgi:meso-butanediol dehydrogenase/(S,S)-butanediol dehydrogenase/diacetyl reductase
MRGESVNRLSNKIAFITGTADGQGRAAALLFAREGATVVGCDLKNDASAETERLVREAGGRMFTHCPVDLGDRAATRDWIDQGVREAGGIDILYNNAGSVRFDAIAEVSPENWQYTLRNELDLVFHATQAAWPHLLARGGGAIINTASASALRGNSRLGATAHAAAKGGVIAMSQQLAAEGAAHNIRVNTISPGAIRSPATEWMAPENDRVRASIPLGRWGKPEDIAYCALYLASDEAAWVTAAHFVVDGGITGIRQ